MTLTNAVEAIIYNNPASYDAFSRLRVSNVADVFNAQLTYDLAPLLYEQITLNTGATIAHNATNRCALMTFASTPAGGKSILQTFEHFRYQPGRSQLIFITFNFQSAAANVVKFAGYSDGSNGIEFQNNGTVNQFVVYSTTLNGNQTVTQTNWNLDKLDGTGPSGITLDISKTLIFVCDFQALYVGKVRCGFSIGGSIIYCHEFSHANIASFPYIASANLPVRCGMISNATVSTTMLFICSSVNSEGGKDSNTAYNFTAGNSITAASGADTYVFSLRPKLTFNSITNRSKISLLHLDFSVTGNSNIFWKLCIGQTLTTPSFNDVNATYSAMQIDTAGTLSGSPLIIIDSGFASSSKVATQASSLTKYPICLNAAGSTRTLGTLTLIVQGIGGNSAMGCQASWQEER